jgi:PleD family two-component response regulator
MKTNVPSLGERQTAPRLTSAGKPPTGGWRYGIVLGVEPVVGPCDMLGAARQLPQPEAHESSPASKMSAAAEQPQVRIVPKQKVILIADDDAAIRESLAAVLRSEKYQVRLAENGRVAVREFLQGPPDLVLLDLNMPDTDGWRAFEVMARLAPYVPVAVITLHCG